MQLLVIHSEVRIVDYVVVPQVKGHIPGHGGRQLFPVEIHRPSLVKFHFCHIFLSSVRLALQQLRQIAVDTVGFFPSGIASSGNAR